MLVSQIKTPLKMPRTTSFLSRSDAGRPIALKAGKPVLVHIAGERQEKVRIHISNHDPTPRDVLIYIGRKRDPTLLRFVAPPHATTPIMDDWLVLGRQHRIWVALVAGSAACIGRIEAA